jgi:hypothetical protein
VYDERKGPPESAVLLPSRGLGRVASISEHDFVFIGQCFEHRCSKFEAAFLSPRVHSLLLADRTVESIVLASGLAGNEEQRLFEAFVNLYIQKDAGIVLNSKDRRGFLQLAHFLGNREIIDQLFRGDDPVSLGNVCLRLIDKPAFDVPIDEEIDFASLHFSELDSEVVRGLDISILERIVSSPSLCLRDEDSLVDFICNHQVLLLRYVQCEYLTCEGIKKLLAVVSLNDIDALMWESILRRLFLPVSSSSKSGMVRFTPPPSDREPIVDRVISSLAPPILEEPPPRGHA